MKECCSECFADSELKYRVSRNAIRYGHCSRCGSTGAIAKCDSLESDFSLLLDAYEESADGELLADCLQRDWHLFSGIVADKVGLLDQILPASRGQKFQPRLANAGEPLESWTILRDQLRRINRFFPSPAPDIKLMQELTGLLVAEYGLSSDALYRARVRRHEKRFSLKDMGSPPATVVGPGRANPVGIPYLYLASNLETAVAEVRPSVADVVCVVKFRPISTLKLVDLVDPSSSISPFKVDADSLHRVRGSMGFLNALGAELRTPTPPHRATSDYLATQYLCEMIKSLGYDGVRYKSALGNGLNLAIFSPELFRPEGRVVEREVSSIAVATRKI